MRDRVGFTRLRLGTPGTWRPSQRPSSPGRRLPANGGAPEGPTDLRARSWFGVLKRTVKEFREDNLTDWAAALTYYGILSIFPALLVFVSVLGLIGESATQPLLDNLATVAPGPAQEIFTNAIENLNRSQGAAGLLFVVGLAAALWSASSYVGAFMRASNSIYEVEEGRPFWKLRPVQIAITLVMVILLSIGAVAVVLTGPLAEEVGRRDRRRRRRRDRLGHRQVAGADPAREPDAVGALLGRPEREAARLSLAHARRRRWPCSCGSSPPPRSRSTSRTSAPTTRPTARIGGVIVFLIWLWISNIAVLLGAELNAELERGRSSRPAARRARAAGGAARRAQTPGR